MAKTHQSEACFGKRLRESASNHWRRFVISFTASWLVGSFLESLAQHLSPLAICSGPLPSLDSYVAERILDVVTFRSKLLFGRPCACLGWSVVSREGAVSKWLRTSVRSLRDCTRETISRTFHGCLFAKARMNSKLTRWRTHRILFAHSAQQTKKSVWQLTDSWWPWWKWSGVALQLCTDSLLEWALLAQDSDKTHAVTRDQATRCAVCEMYIHLRMYADWICEAAMNVAAT